MPCGKALEMKIKRKGIGVMSKMDYTAEIYNEKIRATIPCYEEFGEQIVSLVKALGKSRISWLDTGCGTGNVARIAVERCDVREMVLADPLEEMIEFVKEVGKEWKIPVEYILGMSQELRFKERFDVVTAIQCHHYLRKEDKVKAVKACYEALKPGGVFISFENTKANTEEGKEIALDRWRSFQLEHGKGVLEVEKHLKRYGVEYFPITVWEQLEILKECGFQTAEILWYSYCQAGVYGLKG